MGISFVLLLFPILAVPLLSQMMACLAKGKVVKLVIVWVPHPCSLSLPVKSSYSPLVLGAIRGGIFSIVFLPFGTSNSCWVILAYLRSVVWLGSNQFYFTSPLGPIGSRLISLYPVLVFPHVLSPS